MHTIRVAVVGAAGRIGKAVCHAVDSAADMELVARVDVNDDLNAIVNRGAEVVVDFTVPAASPNVVDFCVNHGVHAVVGTTGWTEQKLSAVEDALMNNPTVGVLIAPNFAMGAVLAMHFAAKAAQYFESVEVIELHHPDKLDAPSGTAQHTAREIAQARRDAGLGPIPDATDTALDGARGADIDGVRVHAVRLRGLVAHEEILFGGPGEQFTIRHDSFDRTSFMPGVLLAVRTVTDRPGLTVGLDHYMDL